MASKRTTKKVVKKVAKAAKKNPTAVIILIVVALVLAGAAALIYFLFVKPAMDRPKESDLTLKLKGSSDQDLNLSSALSFQQKKKSLLSRYRRRSGSFIQDI